MSKAQDFKITHFNEPQAELVTRLLNWTDKALEYQEPTTFYCRHCCQEIQEIDFVEEYNDEGKIVYSHDLCDQKLGA